MQNKVQGASPEKERAQAQNEDQDKKGGRRMWIVIGDIHDRIENLANIPELAEAEAVIISGDLTQLGGCREAGRVLAALPGIPVFAQIGNMDKPETDACLSEKSRNLHGRAYALAPDIAIFGAGGSTPTPFRTPSEFSEEQYSAWLEESWREAEKYPMRILISHNPPRDSACDRLSSGGHAGSSAVRKFIEEKQPDICVCGHIHESRGEDQIGRTKILNPGMLSEGSYVLIIERDGKLEASIKNTVQGL